VSTGGNEPVGTADSGGGADSDGGGPALGALERRLAVLRSEFDNGQARLQELERQEAFLRERLLMLRGAIQAFDELHAELDGKAG
jgi:hypothetical protein